VMIEMGRGNIVDDMLIIDEDFITTVIEWPQMN
jgi:hypothetical protein